MESLWNPRNPDLMLSAVTQQSESGLPTVTPRVWDGLVFNFLLIEAFLICVINIKITFVIIYVY